MTDELHTAEERRLDAALAEVSGTGPAPDLVERITEAVHAAPASRAATPSPRRRHLGAAAVVLLGLGVVVAVAALRGDDPEADPAGARVAEPPPLEEPPLQEPQGKAKKKPPENADNDADAAKVAEARRMAQLIRDLELPARRDTAMRELMSRPQLAIPSLRSAIEAERSIGRVNVMLALRGALQQVNNAERKRRAGLPVDRPVTMFCDYSDNLVAFVDDKGRQLRVMNEIYGSWDCELTDSGTLLITEFSVSRVVERTMQGKIVWSFEQLRNPYDADRLANGNTLISDTFRGRVIEVDRAGTVVWSYENGVRPFDADRLPNGNTLIADVLKTRVIEVTPAGAIVWTKNGLPSVHDADRLANGNTLITLRTLNRVIEVDRAGNEVFRIEHLNSPSDADLLPNGNILVAENNMVREFDRNGKVVWRKDATWAVEVNRY